MMNCRLMKRIILFLSAFCMILILSSCQSVDKDDFYLTIEHVEFEYHENTDVTIVSCQVHLQNDTIYNVRSLDVEFGLYSDGVRLKDKSCHYNVATKHGEQDQRVVEFTEEGKIDKVGLVSCTPNYESIWKTYINVIIVLGIALIAGIVYWIYEKFF